MKIAYFISNRSTFPSSKNEITASSTVVYNIIKHLSLKHEITLYAAKGSTVPPHVKLIDLDISPFSTDSNISNTDWTTKAVLGMKQLYLGELFGNADNYDLIHLHTEPVYLAMSYAHLIKTPILFTCHNAYHDAESSIFSFYDKKVYFSGLSKQQVSRIPFTKQPPVIYNGIEVEQFPFEKDSEGYFLFLGRLHKDKGIETFLDLVKSLPDKKFYIAGKGETSVEESIRKMEKEVNNLTFFGMVPRATPQWFSLISKAKALIAPIQWDEPFGLTFIEAMACGTPVIAYSRGASPEVIKDGVTGYLINQSSEYNVGTYRSGTYGIEGLVETIIHMTSLSNDDYKKLRYQAQTYAHDSFSTEKMASQYEELYKRIVSDNKGPNSL